jgi:hypothetical protein
MKVQAPFKHMDNIPNGVKSLIIVGILKSSHSISGPLPYHKACAFETQYQFIPSSYYEALLVIKPPRDNVVKIKGTTHLIGDTNLINRNKLIMCD